MQNFRVLKIGQLKPSENNPRVELRDIEGLADSIKASGIIVPLVVKNIGNDEFGIIEGHRRHAAATLAQVEDIPCVLRDPKETEKDAAIQRLVANVQRDELMPHEIALGIKIAMSRKVRQKVLAKELGKSEAWVSKYVTIVKAIEKMVKEKGDFDITQTQLGGSNAELVYNWAQRYLNPTAEDVPGGDEEEQGALDLEKGEIEVIKELKVLVMSQTGVAEKTIEIVPAGNTGYEVRIKFKNEKAARDAFGHAFAE